MALCAEGGQDMVFEEIFNGIGRDRIKISIDGDANALLAFAHAERPRQFDFVAQFIFVDEILEFFDDLS